MTPEETAAALAAKDQEIADVKKLIDDKDKELGQAQHTIIELKKKPVAVAPATQQDSEVAAEATRSVVQTEIEKFKVEQSKDTIESVLNSLAATPEEKEKIRTAYNTNIVKTGFSAEAIRADLENAFILSNKPKFDTTIKELQKAAISAGTRTGAAPASHETEKPTEANITDAEKVWVKQTAARLKLTEEAVMKQLLANKSK